MIDIIIVLSNFDCFSSLTLPYRLCFSSLTLPYRLAIGATRSTRCMVMCTMPVEQLYVTYLGRGMRLCFVGIPLR